MPFVGNSHIMDSNSLSQRQDGHSILMNKPHTNNISKVKIQKSGSIDSLPTPTPQTPTIDPPLRHSVSQGGAVDGGGSQGSVGSSPTGSLSPDPVHDLPPELLQAGWRRFWSNREKRQYFFNKLTNESLWEMPPTPAHSSVMRSPSFSDPLGISSPTGSGSSPPAMWGSQNHHHAGDKRRSSTSSDDVSSPKRPVLNYVPFWNFEIHTNAKIYERPPNLYPQPHPEVEALRAQLTNKLRLSYQELCKQRESINAPGDSFNRWLLERKTCDQGVDPMLPSNCKPEVSQSMCREIMDDIPVHLVTPINTAEARRQLFKYAEATKEMMESRSSSKEDRKLVRCYLDEVFKWLRKQHSSNYNYNEYLDRLAHLKRHVQPFLIDIAKASVEGICTKIYNQSCDAVKQIYDKHCQILKDNNLKLLEHAPAVQKVVRSCYAIQPALHCPRQPVVEHTPKGDYRYLTYNSDTLKLTNAHMHKLEQAYQLNCRDDSNYNLFLPRVWCLLRRYHTSFGMQNDEGSSLQSALPVSVFECLNQVFGVTFECFASPLNCYFRQYCSAFADTDCYFGSRGTIFQFYPISGSFEANPPFCEELMDSMVDHFENLLTESDEPLSFIVFVPDWRDPPTEAIMKLDGSKFNRKQIVIPAMKHAYREGLQHLTNSKDISVKAVHGTLVVFLQNEAGYAKWGPTEERIQQLQDAYALPNTTSANSGGDGSTSGEPDTNNSTAGNTSDS